ncbi:OmpA family protein [Thioclava nitratireducens]|uniref:OmpA family protein n=1 Tax=Thioclava nitratireducens TaxID=1915078 RepID=UPI002480A863|nr:OmpA family protein [Thioclava nitratireducens]WGT49241.1 OmpA family protein [Thioclava nitratireducens]
MKTLKTTTALVAGLAALSPAILPFSALAQDSNTAAAECVAKAVADGTPMEQAKADCEANAANADGSAEAAAGTDPANADAPMSDSEADQAAKAAIEGAAPPSEQDPAASSDTPDASAKAAVEGGADVTTQSGTTGTDANADAAAAATTDTDTATNADTSAEPDAAASTDAQPEAAAPAETDSAATANGEGTTSADTTAKTDGSATAATDGSTGATADGSTDATADGSTAPEGQTNAEATDTMSPDTTSQDAPAPVTDTTENAMQNSAAQSESTATAEPEAKPAGETSTDTTSDTQVVQEGNGGSGSDVEPKVVQPKEATTADSTNADANTTDAASADASAEAQTDQQANTQDSSTAEATKLLENALTDTKAAIQGEAVQNEALNAPADSTDTTNATEETVTEDTARSASEDFSTTVDAKPDAQAQATAQTDSKKKKDGLSTLETAALSGLGALAVGAILNNGSKVAVNSGDRVVVQQPDGSYQLVKDDNALLRQPGSKIRTQDYADGSSRTIVTKPDGSQIVTVYDAQRRILKRTLVQPDGTQYLLVNDAQGADPVDVSALPKPKPVATVSSSNEQALREALTRQSGVDRTFTLSQVRNITPVRELAPAITVENINFETGSAAIQPDQAQALSALGQAIQQRIDENPRELFLVEGHTDAVGSAAYNLALSDRRAESVALALSEYFDVPAENLVVQGYGEQDLKVQTEGPSEANRRAVVRRITDLLRTASN